MTSFDKKVVWGWALTLPTSVAGVFMNQPRIGYTLFGLFVLGAIVAAFAVVENLLGPDGDAKAIESHYGPF